MWSPFYVDAMIERDTNPTVTAGQSNGSVETLFGTDGTDHTTTSAVTRLVGSKSL